MMQSKASPRIGCRLLYGEEETGLASVENLSDIRWQIPENGGSSARVELINRQVPQKRYELYILKGCDPAKAEITAN